MRLQDDLDFTTLNWVKHELDETLKEARLALEAFVEDPEDTSQMRFCATYLHQVHGTLRMVELYGAALVVEEMERVALGLIDESIARSDDAYSVLMRGIVQLPDYLERLQSGHRDIPIVLLPLLNDLRATRGEKLLSENVLFRPELDVDLPASASGPLAPVPQERLQATVSRLRLAFEFGLLRWFRDEDADEILTRLITIADHLRSVTTAEEARRLWWVAGGVLEALLVRGLDPSVSVKLLFGRVDREIKRLVDGGEDSFRSSPPDDLVCSLLYYVAHSQATSRRVTELRETFGLNDLLPDASEIEHAKGALAGHNRQLLDTVSGAIKEDLLRVKDALDLHLRKDEAGAADLEPLGETLEGVADTLGMLGLGVPRNVVLEQASAIAEMIEGEREDDEDALLDVAGALLYVESSLDDHIEALGAPASTGEITLSPVTGDAGAEAGDDASEGDGEAGVLAPEAAAPSDNELPQSEVRRILDALIKEAHTNINQAKQEIVAFIEAPWDHSRIVESPRLLEEILGALKMLDLGDPAEVVSGILAYVEDELLAKKEVPTAEELDTLADTVASIEYYLEGVREHRPGRARVLEVARDSVERLRSGSIGGQELDLDSEQRDRIENDQLGAVDVPLSDADLDSEVVADGDSDGPITDEFQIDGLDDDDLSVAGEGDTDEFTAPSDDDLASFDWPPSNDEDADAAVGEPADAELGASSAPTPRDGEPQRIHDLSNEIDDDIREVYVEEVGEELGNLQELYPRWKDNLEDSESLTTIRRIFHTLKGSGRLVGAIEIGEFSWKIENMLNRVLDESIEAGPAVIEVMDRAMHALPQLQAHLEDESATPSADIAGIMELAERVADGEEVSLDGAASADAEDADSVTADSVEEALDDLAAAADSSEESMDGEASDDSSDADLAAADRTADHEDVDVEETLDLIDLESNPEQAEAADDSADAQPVDSDLAAEAAELLAGADDEIEMADDDGQATEFDLDGLEIDFDAGSDSDSAEAPDTTAIEVEELDLDQLDPDSAAAEAIEVSAESSEAADDEGGESEDASEWDLGELSIDFGADDEALHTAAEQLPEGDTLEHSASEAGSEAEAEADADADADDAEESVSSLASDLIAEAEDLLPTLDLSEESFEDLDADDHPAELDTSPVESNDQDESDLETIELVSDAEDEELEAELEASSDAGSDGTEDFSDLSLAEGDSGELDPVLLEIFQGEVNSHIAGVRAYLDEVANADGPVPVTDDLLRAVHTLNGAAAMIDAQTVSNVTAPLESYVKKLKLLETSPSGEGIVALGAGATVIGALARAIGSDESQIPDTAGLVSNLERLRDELPDPGEGASIFAFEIPEDEADNDVDNDAEAQPESVEADADIETDIETDIEANVEIEAEADSDTDATAQEEAETSAEEFVEESESDAEEQTEAVGSDDETSAAEWTPPTPFRESDSVETADEPDNSGAQLVEVDDELLEIFLQEGNEILDEADTRMASWRDDTNNGELIAGLQRDLHTLKGGARMAGLNPIGDLSHAMESVFTEVAEDNLEVNRTMIDVLEHAFDRLQGMLEKVARRENLDMPKAAMMELEALLPSGVRTDLDDDLDTPRPVQQADVIAFPKVRPGPDSAEADAQAQPLRAQEIIRVRSDLLDNLVNYAGEVSIYRSRLEQQVGNFRFNLTEFEQTVTRLREQLRKLEIETEAQILSRFQREAEEEQGEDFDPLELDRFSQIQQLSRALAESVSDLVSLQEMLDDITSQSETLLLQQSRVSSDLQEGLMRTRMVPFESLVPRLRRILRQASQELGKHAQLRVEGAQGEMDRNVLERITAPLEHMLRNAVAHGIESPESRDQQGKPTDGEIRIEVSREATEVVLNISDDGAGIDLEAVRDRAVERGLLIEGAEFTDRDLLGFILETGFSTADKVTKLAGRGVGLDVVNSEIKQLGGSLDIDTESGKGSSFEVRLPFTLAVTHAIMVRIGDTHFAVPLSGIQSVVRLSQDEFDERVGSGNPVYQFAGLEHQIMDLNVLLGLESQHVTEDDQVPLLMVRVGDRRAAVRVDAVLDAREIVVKSVGPQVSTVPGIFGATILGDGSVVLILDLSPLVRRGAALQLQLDTDVTPFVPEAEPEEERMPMIMVVDDSITMRKVTSRILERNEMEVMTAKDGVDALTQLQERVPDVMLLDIEMPRMDGYELATIMRNDTRLAAIPIIMITSRTGEKHRQRAFDIGVERYLGKPYQEGDLLSNIGELLERESGGTD